VWRGTGFKGEGWRRREHIKIISVLEELGPDHSEGHAPLGFVAGYGISVLVSCSGSYIVILVFLV